MTNFYEPLPEAPVLPIPPITGVSVDVGVGKTWAYRKQVAVPVVADGLTSVLAVPRHLLGDEIVDDLAQDGVTARVYRGREADDPDAPDEKMCRDLDRAKLIEDAGGTVSKGACRQRQAQCEFFDVCGYQRQARAEPDVWIVPHQLLYRKRPRFIPEPDSLTIDEAFWSSALQGIERPKKVWLARLGRRREVPAIGGGDGAVDREATDELEEISRKFVEIVSRYKNGRLDRAMLIAEGVTATMAQTARRLEFRRKQEVDVTPGQPIAEVREIAGRVTAHNRLVTQLARLWLLLARTLESDVALSSWLELNHDESLPTGDGTEPALLMTWCQEIHESWRAPTLVMDATMPETIVREFFPGMPEVRQISAPMPHTRVRQIIDTRMAASMLAASETASEESNSTRRNNVERVRKFLLVRAKEVAPGNVLVVCQQKVELGLRAGELPENVDVQHFNNINGENRWQDVALVIVIGRTEPSPREVEKMARVLFGQDLQEVAPDDKGDIRYPLVPRGIRLRNGTGVKVMNSEHPDPRVEEVRRAICEANLIQAIGRGRGVNRTAANPLQVDILTNIVLPIEVDEVTTWNAIQPGALDLMIAEGAVPVSYPDMTTAYPGLFPSPEAARKRLTRENPGQTPIRTYTIGVCPGFRSITYRRQGARGSAIDLLYDPDRIDPEEWLTSRLGAVALLSEPQAVALPC